MEMFLVGVYDAITGDDQQDAEVFDTKGEAMSFAQDVLNSYIESGWVIVDDTGSRITLSPPGYGPEHVIEVESCCTEYSDHFASSEAGHELSEILDAYSVLGQ